MIIRNIKEEERTPALVSQLVTVWDASVRASHHFLREEDIRKLAPYVGEALQAIDTLIVAFEKEEAAGFMGIEQQKIEMLFLNPAHFGKGLGKKLVSLGFQDYDVAYVDVNEQNPQAVGFYQRMGFKTFRREPVDDQGNPFPILRMERKK